MGQDAGKDLALLLLVVAFSHCGSHHVTCNNDLQERALPLLVKGLTKRPSSL